MEEQGEEEEQGGGGGAEHGGATAPPHHGAALIHQVHSVHHAASVCRENQRVTGPQLLVFTYTSTLLF